MSDRDGVEDALARFVYALDRLRWDDLEHMLAPGFRYGFRDADRSVRVWFSGVDEMLRRLGIVTDRTVVSQHFCPNPLVEVTGDEAALLVNHMAYVWWRTESGPPELHQVAARWEAELVRDNDQWRFAAMVFDPTFLIPWEDDLTVFPPRGPVEGTPWSSPIRDRSKLF